MTLTLYSLHVVSRSRGLVPVDAPDQLVPQVLIMLVMGAVVARLGRRGPLESVLARLSRAARRAALEPAALSPGRRPARPVWRGRSVATGSGEPLVVICWDN